MKAAFLAMFVVLAVLSLIAGVTIPPPPGGNRTTLVWSTDNNPVRKDQADLFNRLNPDLYVTIDPNNTDQQKVIVQSIGGVGPDLFDSYGAGSLLSYVRSGVAMDVTLPLKSKGIDPVRDIWKVGLDSCMMDGRIYGFPANTGGSAIWFNKSVFDRAGVPYPKPGWSWSDLIATAQKLTIRDARGRAKQYGLYWDWNSTYDLVYQFGGRQFTPDGTRCLLDSPEAIAGIQLSHDLLYKYKVAPSPVEEAALSTNGGWGTGGITYLMGGRVAMAYGGRWWLNLMRQDKTVRLGCIEIPYQKVPVTVGGSRVTLVNYRGKNIDAALRFIEFLTSREYNELVNKQADAMASVKKYCYTDEFLHNPEHPEEDYNAIWRRAVERAIPAEVCPYLPGSEMAPITDQIDLIKNDVKPVPQAMREAVKNANARILRNARIRPYLHDMYVRATGREP